MIWTFPLAFSGLAAIAAAFYFVARQSKKRRADLIALFSERLFSQATPPVSPALVLVKRALLALSLIAFVLTLAGPRFGVVATPSRELGRDIFVLLDVSESMLAEDVAPNRLTIAKLDVEDLLNAAVGDRIGLIAFAGSAQVEIPPTNDRALFREMLQSVDETTVALQGTAIGDALRLAVERLGDGSDGRERAIVLVADGEDHSSLPLEAANRAKSSGVPIYAVAIGDVAGAKIPVFNAAGRRVGYKIFDGVETLSKPDVATMQEIARISGGRYFYADATFDMKNVYDEAIDKLKRSAQDGAARSQFQDRYRPFLVFGLVAFALSRCVPTRVSFSFKRRTKRSQRVANTLLICLAFIENFNAISAFANETPSPSAPSVEKNENADAASSASPPDLPDRDAILKNRRSEIAAFNRCVDAARNGRSEEAEALRLILLDAASPEVVARTRFNQAAETVEQAVAEANSSPSNDAPPSTPTSSSETSDPVERYRQERDERFNLRQDNELKLENAARLFIDAASRSPIRERSEQAAESTRAWLAGRRDLARQTEVEERRRFLADPDARLRWLRDEIRRRVEKSKTPERDAAYYADLATLGDELDAWNADAVEAAEALAARCESTNATDATAVSCDPEAASKIRDALAEFSRRRQSAAQKFAAFDGDAGADELRRADSRLAAMQEIATPYPTLALRLADDEAKRDDELKESVDGDKSFINNDFRASRETLRESAAELVRKARRIVAQTPSESDAPDAAPSDARFDAKKIRESALLAVELEDELSSLIKETQELASNDSSDANRSLLDAEKRLVETLQKIVRPLRDENEPNPDDESNDQDQNSSSQNQQNQDDKNQNKNQDSDANDDRFDANDSQNRKPPTDADGSDDADEPENPEKNDDGKDEKTDAPKAETPTQLQRSQSLELTEEQKKADELTLQVRRRRQAAEETRRAVRKALQSRDSVGKDW